MERVDLWRSVKHGVIILNLSYNIEFAGSAHGEDSLSTLLVSKYNDGEGGPSCIVVIDAEIGSGFTMRGLFALYKAVRKHEGRLICVGYPENYIEGLYASGMTSNLGGFSLSDSLEQALEEIKILGELL